jgi:hypothetical protein
MPMAAEVIQAFAAATVQPGVPDEALREIGQALVAIQAQYGAQLEALARTLPAEQQQGLLRVMNAVAGAQAQ